jgi:hypothetical protein
MSGMTKVRGAQNTPSEPAIKLRRKRSALPADQNEQFTRAFADALRDILHEEFRVVP